MVESAPLPSNTKRISPEVLRTFVSDAFIGTGFSRSESELVADVLVNADLRGVRSHGVARVSYFMVRIERSLINTQPNMTLRRGSDTTAVLDADNGLGIVASDKAMDEAIAMASEHGSGFVAVANSNHFGYAGYWAERALEHNYLGISMSNSGGRVTPTFANESLLGTNPFAVSLGGGPDGTDFSLDMATSAVAVGKIETALREGRPVPDSWVSVIDAPAALDDRGVLTYDTPLLPLGGGGDEAGGHKGFGLNLMVELMCGALSGTPLAERIAGASGESPAAMAHFFGAINIEGFRSVSDVHESVAETISIVRNAKKAPGHNKIFIHGEREAIAEVENTELGVPVTPAVRHDLETVARSLNVDVPW